MQECPPWVGESPGVFLRLEVYKVCPATADPLCEGPTVLSIILCDQIYIHSWLLHRFLRPPSRETPVLREMSPAKMSALQSSKSCRTSIYNNGNDRTDQVSSTVGLNSNTCHQLERVQPKQLDKAAEERIAALIL